MNSPESPASEPRLEVLLVEDTLDEALLIRTLLENALGCKVTLAQDGIRGCQLAENQEWDLLVTDLNLPGQDGMEVIARSREAFPDTPIIATTGYTGSHYGEQALRSGADDVLTKPLEPAELIARVEALTAGRRSERAGSRGPRPERTVLAVGALPGDVELGCGGILLGHRAHEHRVVLLVMSGGGSEETVADRRSEAEAAADVLGVELVLGDPFRGKIPSVDAMISWLAEVVQDIDPDTVYTPSPNEVRDSRLRTYQSTLVEGSGIPNHYCYQAPTSTLEFKPSLFIDVAEYMSEKVKALECFRGEKEFRPHLQPDIARATATYWGRFLGYAQCEPLEVHRSSS